MMYATPIILPEIVPQRELLDWRKSLRQAQADNTPAEVKEFIEALAAKLPDYARVGRDLAVYTGHELRLCGLNQYEQKEIVDFAVYKVEVPRLKATDEALSMYRIYQRKGRQGLIDYCRAKVKGSELEKLLNILNVHVFYRESEAFLEVMDSIYNSKKLSTNNE